MHRFIKQLRYTAKLINPILDTLYKLARIAFIAMAFSHPAASAPDVMSSISMPSIQIDR
jgi:hypothetical protein